MKDLRWPLLVTLTTTNTSTGDGLRVVRRAFGKMRRHRWFLRCAPNGVAAFEVTHRGRGFHPHVHALIDCRWFSITVPPPRFPTQIKDSARRSCTEVAQLWSDLCGSRSSIHVRRVYARPDGDITDALREVVKYAVKPSTLIGNPHAGAMIDALCRTRCLTSWGSMYRHPELKRKRAACCCEVCSAQRTMVPEFVIEAQIRAGRKLR
jgi:hypothetical protein